MKCFQLIERKKIISYLGCKQEKKKTETVKPLPESECLQAAKKHNQVLYNREDAVAKLLR